ncbi:MAG: hypothetical protein JST42_26500 [Bacteroidetes bacterium]|nr:hypothetical protein [Bacteroidota bacterium]
MYPSSSAPPDTTAETIAKKLIDWQVEVVFGLVSDQDSPLVRALTREPIRYIAVHHARSAALLAASYARCSDTLGVCTAFSGPTARHLLNGLADAARETVPILAITSAVDYDRTGTPFIVFNHNITGPIHALTVVDLACRSALNTPGITHITAALDSQPGQFSIWPQYLAAAISHRIKDDAILAADPKARTIFSTRHWHTRNGRPLTIANTPATPGFPYALAAQLAWPNRQCVALINDDNAVTLMDELSTAVNHHLPVKTIILKDSLSPIDFTKLASSFGMEAYNAKQPGELQSILRQAFSSPYPTLIEVELETATPAPPQNN